MATSTSLMTAEELLALPDDGIDRELIRGELREYPMTMHGAPHGRAMSNLAFLLVGWHRQQPAPRGQVFTGDARVRVRRNPDTFVGVDLVYISADLAARTPKRAPFIDGPPVLAIEILSPSNTAEQIAEKVHEFLDAGMPLVWEVNPFYETVLVHRPDAPPELFNDQQELTAEPHLPGFRVPVAEIFAD